jgi:hypothetical protein
MSLQTQLSQASIQTADNLRTVAHSIMAQNLSRLSLPEIETAVDLVARLVPAGNVPGLILNGLARLPGRRPPAATIRRDIDLLFKGVEAALDTAVYGAFFAGPAAVIWGYQHLLKLAGKEPESAFPDGVWQFYVDYALREDTARHANETHGFDTMLRRHGLEVRPADRLAAWIMAAIHCLHQYPDLLANEWRERMFIYLLELVTAGQAQANHDRRLYQAWEKEKPYGRTSETAPGDNYATYRRLKFDQFLAAATGAMSPALRATWLDRCQALQEELDAYQRQMSILAYLEPGPYAERHVPLSLAHLHVGLIYEGQYHLIPACEPAKPARPAGPVRPADPATVRDQIAALLSQAARPGASLQPLAALKRTALPEVRRRLSPALVAELDRLRLAPILVNADLRSHRLPLAEIRQAERGAGDHALTIFDTGQSIVFDQSHIFFDGAWGATLAEILTREALSWAVYFHGLPPAPASMPLIKPLALTFTAGEQRAIAEAAQVAPETSAETDAVKLAAVLALRRLFKQRSDLLTLTVNDLLILYRAIHAAAYRPDPALLAQVQALARQRHSARAAKIALEILCRSGETVPAVLIPIDVSRRAPRDRLFPLVFEAPLHELNLLALHRQTMEALDCYEQAVGDRTAAYAVFDQLQRHYLATLAGFGAALSRAKEIALRGESGSVGAIKLLAHMPPPIQRLLDNVPGRFDLLNDLIKGSEVFSNVGAVAPGSSLTRFITAKDDNDKKSLAWGVLTDAAGVMRLTLRDFRRHVGALNEVGCRHLALAITQHTLESYAHGFNDYVRDLRRITVASRETRLGH